MIITGDREFYKGIGKIEYEGKESDNPLAFKYSMIKSLKKIKGDRGVKKLIRLNKSKVKFVKIKSKSILIDFDQLKDFPSTT